MWSINVKFLRGVCVATDTGQWNETEWPPHPSRVFMALAAAYFETAGFDSTSEKSAKLRHSLEWLEQQAAPRILASNAETRTPISVFVPVNDSTSANQLLPLARGRKERFFPTSIPDRETVHYIFDDDIDSKIAANLEVVAGETVRIGHSSSLTQVWIEPDFTFPSETIEEGQLNEWTPADPPTNIGAHLRVWSAGTLQELEASYNLAAIEEYAELESEMTACKGKQKKEAKAILNKRFPNGMPPSHRPKPALTIHYSKHSVAWHRPAETCFSPDLLVLSMHEAPRIGLESTLQMAGAVRKKIHDAFPNRTSPEWLGGHQADSSPSTTPHVAIVPLPFAGHEYADGHLLGIALVMPRHVSKREQATALRCLFQRTEHDEWLLQLRLNHFRRLTDPDAHCNISLIREQRLTPPRSLDPQTWTAACTVWETITPIVLDRFPKTDRCKYRAKWNAEVAETVSFGCKNIGLPKPSAVHIHHNSFLTGIPNASSNSGFPLMASRPGKTSRYQVHARLVFDIPVVGPVILGAGRFVGYGFCRPNLASCQRQRTCRTTGELN